MQNYMSSLIEPQTQVGSMGSMGRMGSMDPLSSEIKSHNYFVIVLIDLPQSYHSYPVTETGHLDKYTM